MMARYDWNPPQAQPALPPKPKRPPATVKEGWKLPDPPECPDCGHKAQAAVHNTGDGWVWGWDCPNNECGSGPDPFCWCDGDPGVGEMYEWPFNEDWAQGTDWEAVGVDVV